jgi:DNA-binding beta-propeller fold protein YncE
MCSRLEVSDDGRLLYALAFDRADRDYFWIVKGEPFLSVLELATGRETARVPLPGVKVGTDEEDVTYRPAAVLDDASRRYYIAHAGSDDITVVDLATGSVTTNTVTAKGGKDLPARLLRGLTAFFVGKAEAKGSGAHSRQASLSHDAGLLLVSGIDNAYDAEAAVRPSGLRIIDTRTLKLLHHEEGINQFVLTEDGSYVLATGYASYFKSNWTPEEGAGLKVIDLNTMELAATIEPGTGYVNMAPTQDGRYLHLTSEGPARAQVRRDGLDSCVDDRVELILDVVDLENLKLVSRQQSEVSFSPRFSVEQFAVKTSAIFR